MTCVYFATYSSYSAVRACLIESIPPRIIRRRQNNSVYQPTTAQDNLKIRHHYPMTSGARLSAIERKRERKRACEQGESASRANSVKQSNE